MSFIVVIVHRAHFVVPYKDPGMLLSNSSLDSFRLGRRSCPVFHFATSCVTPSVSAFLLLHFPPLCVVLSFPVPLRYHFAPPCRTFSFPVPLWVHFAASRWTFCFEVLRR